MEHYCLHRFSRKFGFHQDIPTDIGFSILLSSMIMLGLHQACIRYGTNSQVLSPCQGLSLERKFTQRFQEWWSNVFPASSCTQSTGNSKRKGDSLVDQNIRRGKGASGSRPLIKFFFRLLDVLPKVGPQGVASAWPETLKDSSAQVDFRPLVVLPIRVHQRPLLQSQKN